MTKPETIRQTTIVVPELCCATEEQKVRKKFQQIQGISDVKVNFVAHTLVVHHEGEDAPLIEALDDIGLPGTVRTPSDSHRLDASSRRQTLRFAVSSGLLVAALLSSLAGLASWIDVSLTVAAILLSGAEIATKAGKSLRNGILDINVLMTIATAGALALGKTSEAAAVIVLYALSLLLESKSMERTRTAIRSLMKVTPPVALLLTPDGEREVPSDSLEPGAVIRVKPGARIPADGTVVKGQSSVDQSPLTGESIAVHKSSGDPVFAGTYNQRGALDVRVLHRSSDSRLAAVVHLVEEAESKRAQHQSFIDVFARIYTPVVFVLAIGVSLLPPLLAGGEFSTWIYRALVLLVISCPCALVISTPVTLVSAITNAARSGLLIKGGKHLETLASLRTLAIDKTGTLTRGVPAITAVLPLDSARPEHILAIAATLEQNSEHQLAEAFVRKAAEDGIDLQREVRAFEAIHGMGVRATVDGTPYTLGNHQLAHSLGVCTPELERRMEEYERDGNTVVVLADERHPLGLILLRDEIRHESRTAVEELHALGVRPVVLLSGDNANASENVAREIGVDDVRASLLPDEKLAAVETLRKEHGMVGMVGDGVNDAPALAVADVGIAMGAVGSETAVETADIVLMSENLSRIPHGIALGRLALRIIRQNIAAALVVKAIFVVLGVMGWTSLWLAILADDGVTLAVVANSIRALRFER